MFIQGFNQIIENYLSCQGVSKPLLIINITSIFMVLFFGRIFLIDLKLKQIGFAYTKLVQEGTNFVIFVILLFKVAHPETLIIPDIMENLRTLYSYLKASILSILSFYGEFISFELNTYFAALLPNLNQLAVWVLMSNYTIIYFLSSVGLSFAVRNIVGNLIGKK